MIDLSNQVLVTVYMDDLILSGKTLAAVADASKRVLDAAAIASFPVSENKTAIALSSVEAFNCTLTHDAMRLKSERLNEFADQWAVGTEASQRGIGRYVEAINPEDVKRLASLVAVTV